MKCPNCKNRGFQPIAFVRRPLVNMGNVQRYATFVRRKYVCLQCGQTYTTVEKLDELTGKIRPEESANVRENIGRENLKLVTGRK